MCKRFCDPAARLLAFLRCQQSVRTHSARLPKHDPAFVNKRHGCDQPDGGGGHGLKEKSTTSERSERRIHHPCVGHTSEMNFHHFSKRKKCFFSKNKRGKVYHFSIFFFASEKRKENGRSLAQTFLLFSVQSKNIKEVFLNFFFHF